MKKVIPVLAILALLPGLSASAETFTVHSAATLYNLGMQAGWDGGNNYDILAVGGGSGTIGAGAIDTPFSFEVGYNSHSALTPQAFSLTRAITIGATTFDLTQNGLITIGSSDTLQIFAATLYQMIGGLTYRITAAGFGPFTFENGVYNRNMGVEVDVVPEPASMVLLGTGLIGLAAAARRRSRKK